MTNFSEIFCMQDTTIDVLHTESHGKFTSDSARHPIYNPKEADGSKRQILSVIGPANADIC